jgi:hypothetical protein
MNGSAITVTYELIGLIIMCVGAIGSIVSVYVALSTRVALLEQKVKTNEKTTESFQNESLNDRKALRTLIVDSVEEVKESVNEIKTSVSVIQAIYEKDEAHKTNSRVKKQNP